MRACSTSVRLAYCAALIWASLAGLVTVDEVDGDAVGSFADLEIGHAGDYCIGHAGGRNRSSRPESVANQQLAQSPNRATPAKIAESATASRSVDR